ncbi:MAG: MazF family transcriptional regulator [Armatimonadetes bacterium CG07_land_8_20_14_0_80_40_9]|nr:MAG: MazF family transcriptional regulator [Armatimonadetes bacterium CG07_land_8_20_14_0_80_40_9]
MMMKENYATSFRSLQKVSSQNFGIPRRTKCGMSIYRQRDIVLVPFPFSDLSIQKVRPVLILSNDAYNQQSSDIVVCGLTTNLRPAPYSIIVDVADVEQPGTLRHKSRIKVDTIASLEQSIIVKQIARLKLSVFRKIVTKIGDLVKTP